jgi:hypothetical protein
VFSAGGVLADLIRKAPSEEFAAGGTEFRHLGIRIPNTSGRVHHTGTPPTVYESQRVTQFMQSSFHQPLQQQGFVLDFLVVFGPKPVQGDDCALTFHLGSTEDVFESGHKEV